ncbi:protein-disulfide reductase DsbD family protein [Reinekea marinisedimentorum]|uniref:Thiol:disulfide interchange protein DsbD n=1 Tax=Reinekea marinisedimentorum TaxID=230495 RepID=A0A4R3IB17_9GAMM|nr:protein-disulfide reductase DsbD domain-containing protein [Reinekea marinisedimentorum]TCS42640.1 thiol:disulfide interchange protein DsbD [Reinekea marinisedimentorum]
MKQLCGLFLFALALCSFVAAEEEFVPVDQAFQVNVSRNGAELYVDFEIRDGYYLYRDKYKLTAFDGLKATEPKFSLNEIITFDPNFNEDLAVFYGYMEVTHQVTAESGYFEVTYQGCADAGLCYAPQKRLFGLDGMPYNKPATAAAGPVVNVGQAGPADQPLNYATALTAAAFALLGGFILNLMPCVFPVLSIKAFSIARHSHSAAESRSNALAYSAGVILSFVLVALMLLVIRGFGDWVGWGFQLQSPAFVSFLVVLFFLMALTMSGYVTVSSRWMGLGDSLSSKAGLTGSFFTGVLATVVATPCTAPFMGTAIGFALAQSPLIGLLIFAFMGLGLSLPVLAIGFLPRLAGYLPKPGKWMHSFQQFLAFPLFLTSLWLLWLLVQLDGSLALLKVGTGLVLIAMAVWPVLSSAGRTAQGTLAKRGAQLLLVVAAAWSIFSTTKPDQLWVDYSEEIVSEALNKDRPVFIDVTADWCITCKVNEKIALSGSRFETLVAEHNVLLVRADWTEPSASIDQLIAQYNRQGVPLYLYYPAGQQQADILPQLLTLGLIEEVFTGGS